MLLLPTDWACETGLPPETGIPGSWDSAVPVSCRRQRSEGTTAEHTEQPDMLGTFLLLHLLTRVVFELGASYSFINASCVTEVGLEVEAFREARCRCSSLGCRVRVDLIGRDYE